ncbi:MAG: CHAD domain-containing protein [Magnetococcales bacterium]|nr:CHAD domain-containing protein [Magnetococcales bacterium]
MRVALRRLRSALVVFRRAVPREITAWHGEEMRWLASAMAPARDWDVLLTIEPFAIAALTRRYGKLLRQGESIGRMSSEESHQLRIACKKFRYALEFFDTLPGCKGVGHLLGHLKNFQECLGIINDASLITPLLTRLLVGVEDRDTLLCAGAVMR